MNGQKNTEQKQRDRIGRVLSTLYVLMLAASAILIIRLVTIQVGFKPDSRIAPMLSQQVINKTLVPIRGYIIDRKGRLLATSFPRYQIYMDCCVRLNEFSKLDTAKAGKMEREWRDKAKVLSEGLAEHFPEKTAAQFYSDIIRGRTHNARYMKIGHPVELPEYRQLCQLPLFNEGKGKGGMIAEKDNIRRYPFGTLAFRTLGFVRDNKKSAVGNTHVGLEGKFDDILHGKEGRMSLKITDEGWIQDKDSAYVKAIDGEDIRTTLDIDFQDIADKALRAQLTEEKNVEGGCVVLMEVKTGAVRAMVNLLRNPRTGALEESQNLAIGRLGEPGSVFKSVVLMTAIQDGYIKSLDETIPTNHGRYKGFDEDEHIRDYERQHKTDQIPIIEGFKVSSNYMFRYIINKYYGKNPQEFFNKLKDYKLTEAFDFDVEGMGTPSILNPKSKYWSATDLPSMGTGYSIAETPLHILTFYNAVANKGKMMKPYLVESIEKNGSIRKRLGPSVLNPSICSPATADTLTRGLRAVTEEGTAKRLKGAKCSVAGKTGTSRVALPGGGYYSADGSHQNQGTFVGFFPAEDPQYSIIAVVYSCLSHQSFYGGTLPAMAVREIVDEIYGMDTVWEDKLQKPEKKKNETKSDN